MKRLLIAAALLASPAGAQSQAQAYICTDLARERITLSEAGSAAQAKPLQRFELVLSADKTSAQMRALSQDSDLTSSFATYPCKAQRYSIRCSSASTAFEMAWTGSFARVEMGVVSQRLVEGEPRDIVGEGQFRIHSGTCTKS